ncbi:MAG TPA: glycosyltransferase, partial [Tepidisphaeraceae bacterium]|nr:glycosyltransferase [Tepidisphaeraceae bacterium]
CFFPDELNPNCIKVFLDTDPGYNQIVMHERPAWSHHVDRWIQQVRSHDRHFTYAENIYGPDCIIPRLDINWIPTRCVVTLPQWEKIRNTPPPKDAAFTTVMSWSYFGGPLVYKGVEYGAKAPEYEKFHDLPKHVKVPLVLAVGGYHQDAERIKADGWRWVDARPMSLTPHSYARFIQQSLAEWSIAKNVYVATRSGWFSCRTACYLAAGRPAVVQETGWSRFIPSGEGVIAFETKQQAADAIHEVVAHPEKHRAAAYEIAREYLTPQRVLTKMIDQIFCPPPATPATDQPQNIGQGGQ